MTTAKKTDTHSSAAENIFEMSTDEFHKRVAQARPHVEALLALFPGLVSLTVEARSHSQGKFRDGEAAALSSVLDAVKAKPALFASLADEDEGLDPKALEVDLLRDRLNRADQLHSLLADLGPLTQQITDTQLTLGGLVRPFLLAAYRICKTHAKTDTAMQSLVSKALDFYGAIGAAAAATRAAKKHP